MSYTQTYLACRKRIAQEEGEQTLPKEVFEVRMDGCVATGPLPKLMGGGGNSQRGNPLSVRKFLSIGSDIGM